LIHDIKKNYGSVFDGHIEHDLMYNACYQCNGKNKNCDKFIGSIWFDNLKKKGYNPYKILERENKKKTIKKPNFLEKLIGAVINK